MKNAIQIGDRVEVSGEVYYGDKWYRVSSEGTVEDIKSKCMLITIDMIDGDMNACVFVNRKYVHGIKRGY